MRLQISCDLAFDIQLPTPFILMLRPRSGAQQWVVREEYKLTPHTSVFEFTDVYGNLCQRLIAPVGPFTIHTEAEVEVADEIDRAPGAPFVEVQYLPNDVLAYLLPSRFCESDCFNLMAMEITAGQLLGYDQVAAIERWLRDSIRYVPGSSERSLSAIEVNQQGYGVCRDLAHLGIALCRGLSIPARMVVGYLHNLRPMDLHAWFEAYVGGRWYSFDAVAPSDSRAYVSIGYGRDAADVAIYNQFGPVAPPVHQAVNVTAIDNPGG